MLVAVLLAGSLLAACGGGPSAPTLDRKAAPAAIRHAYDVLFDFSNPSIGDKVAVIEDGSSVRGALRQALASPLASLATGAKVTKTTILEDAACKAAAVPAPCARVRYDILGAKGAVLYGGSGGYAVFDGTWRVAHSTVCGLLATMYETLGKKGTPSGC